MVAEVEIGPGMDSFQLLETEGEVELDIGGSISVMGQFLMIMEPVILRTHTEVHVPFHTIFLPLAEPLHLGSRFAEELHLHLLEFAHAEDELTGDNLIAEGLSDLCDTEKGTDFNGYRTLEYTTVSGEHKTYEYNRYEGQIGGVPGKGQSATMNISIGNNFEAKVRDYADTTGKGSKKVKLIDQLNFSTGCNFLADSLKWNPISVNISTTLFNAVSLQGSMSLDPYAVGPGGRRINKAAVMVGQGLVRMTSASISASYSISGKGHIDGNDGTRDPSGSGGGGGGGVQTTGTQDFYQRIFYHPVTGEFIPGGWLYYTNPNVPWSVNFSYSFRVTRNYGFDNETQKMTVKNSFSNTLNLSGNIKLTPKLSLNATTGFDFVAMKMTTTQISATYDLHCFNISVSWVPTGTWQSYSFRIAANAAALADILRFKKSSSFWDK